MTSSTSLTPTTCFSFCIRSENNSAISGSGSLVIGRPSAFNFLGGNWDDPNNFSPALLPESGEKVIVDGVTIEAQSTPFLGDMFVQNNGTIRLRRQDSESLGSITMYQNTSVSYATSGPGFTLKAPIVLEGDIALLMNSSHEEGSVMNLPGTFKGDYNIRVESTRDAANTATVALGGDNSFFTGTWDLTKASPNTEGAVIINGLVENAFGEAKIMLNAGNLAVFNHPKCAGNNLNISVYGNAKALLNHDIVVGEFILNDEVLEKGTYLYCQCGYSKDQPFCNGYHHGSKIKPLKFEVKSERKVSLCNCKLTKTPPYCDNSHLVTN